MTEGGATAVSAPLSYAEALRKATAKAARISVLEPDDVDNDVEMSGAATGGFTDPGVGCFIALGVYVEETDVW